MVTAIVYNFRVEADVLDGATNVVTAANQGASAVHRVRVTNLTTIPYDLELDQVLPDPLNQRPFSYSHQASAGAWTTTITALMGPKYLPRTESLDLHGPPMAHGRIQTLKVRYRTATNAPGGALFTAASTGVPINLTFTVT